MMRYCAVAGFAIAAAIAGCSKGPSSPAEQHNLEQQSAAALQEFRTTDPGIDSLLANSAGYAVFPSIGAAGALFVGGAHGQGVLYEQGRPTGFVTLNQGNAGFTAGGQTYAELVVLRNQYDVDRLKAGKFDIGAGITAVVIKPGAAAEARTGMAVFVKPKGGLMAGVTVSGQTINFQPRG